MRRAWIEMTTVILEEWLTGRGDGPDTWVTSSLPDDLRVVDVAFLDWRRPDVLRITVESASFDEVPEAGTLPRCEPIFTRHYRAPVEASA